MLKRFTSLFSRRKEQEIFYSQYAQDKWLYENFFSKRGGVFVEIGADDGIDKSNTYFFEKTLGWSGLCVEPSPSRFEKLKNNRSCVCEQLAISDTKGVVEFMDIRGWGKGLSGIVDNYDPKHVSRIEKEMGHPENLGHSTIEVKTDRLSCVLEHHSIDRVDFCTIDTEGSEVQVVNSIDFDRCSFGIILIENNYEDTQVEALLSAKGFSKIARVAIDDVYAHASFDLGSFSLSV